jgi:5'-3' exonuclease
MFSRSEKNGLNPLDCFQQETIKLTNLYPNDRHIFAIDCKRGETWRTTLLPEYKGNRPSPSPELLYFRDKMVGWIKSEFEFYYVPTQEADDIIGTITTKVEKSLIVSNDGDYQQLLKQDKV